MKLLHAIRGLFGHRKDAERRRAQAGAEKAREIEQTEAEQAREIEQLIVAGIAADKSPPR